MLGDFRVPVRNAQRMNDSDLQAPLPFQQLWKRVQHGKSAKERHHCT